MKRLDDVADQHSQCTCPSCSAWLGQDDYLTFERMRRSLRAPRPAAGDYRAQLNQLVTRFPRSVQYFGDWHQ